MKGRSMHGLDAAGGSLPVPSRTTGLATCCVPYGTATLKQAVPLQLTVVPISKAPVWLTKS